MTQPEPLTEQQLDEINADRAILRTAPGNSDDWDDATWGAWWRTAERVHGDAPAPTVAPLAASQPSEAPVEPETATEPPTGRVGDPRRTLTPNEYDAAWHAVEGAAGEEGADPGTVLHAVLDRLGIEWQDAAQPTA